MVETTGCFHLAGAKNDSDLRPVWLCTWSGNQGEGQGPSGRYSSPLTRKKTKQILLVWDGLAFSM